MILKSAYAAALVAALAACSASAHTETASTNQPATGATPLDPTDAIQRYVAGEDNNFGDLQGDPINPSSGAYSYFTATQQIPGASNCVVYVYKGSQDHFSRCDLNATNLSDAKNQYQTWLKNLQSAEPYWHTVEVSPVPSGDSDATLLTDNRETHGIFLELSKTGASYRVSTTYAKMSALRS